MKIRYLSVAEFEFDEAVAWYLARSPSAARHFGKEVRIVERLLLKHPRIGRCVELDARSLCVNDFPYNLIYSIEKTGIAVVAVAHHSRHPGYWKDRLRDTRIGQAKGEFEAPGDIDAHNAEIVTRFTGPG